jgi:UDP-2,3-diacylglucosamine pyrophosphatase LpxH
LLPRARNLHLRRASGYPRRSGSRLVFVPGNHDEGLRDYVGLRFGGIEIHQDIVHTTAKGRRHNVIHGDECDVSVRTARWLKILGDYGYEFALWLNHPLNWCRRHFGLGNWSLSAYSSTASSALLPMSVHSKKPSRRRLSGVASTA